MSEFDKKIEAIQKPTLEEKLKNVSEIKEK